jgi:hypothetical protein
MPRYINRCLDALHAARRICNWETAAGYLTYTERLLKTYCVEKVERHRF